MKVTFLYQDPREIYTEQYPLERPQVAERYRGAPRLNVNPDTDETMCIACDLCALACPEHLIMVSSERNEKTRRKELTDIHLRSEPLYVLRTLRRRLSDRRFGTHTGFRIGQLHARRRNLEPRDAGKRSAAYPISQLAFAVKLERRASRAVFCLQHHRCRQKPGRGRPSLHILRWINNDYGSLKFSVISVSDCVGTPLSSAG